ncbi:hypothetical protein [Ornithinimicrobium cryptoxanthini]|uniref:Lumazine-binding protein n=1 Tax=Ornithinimicrobium cryptoxanthini TaxID=2934161 RepID=A0ABY4YJ47_9MICO|nr:hypothetical protein [Ornithinimicrobium cryptoxanthini]USQ76265.1 hypothetical protein NF557_17010 [Ornithinimicrobium cryptoxanthini]
MNTRANRVLGIAVGLLVLLAVVAGVISTQQEPRTFAPDTPESTVQTYLQAVLDQDAQTAVAQLGPDVGCTVDDFVHGHPAEPDRVVVTESSVRENSAQIHVDLVFGGGLFGGDGWSDPITFPLERSGDAWVISTMVWPYYGCEGTP